MNLEYKESLENSCLTLTDFTCADGRKLLKETNLYKIIWAQSAVKNIMIDGYEYNFEKNEIIFCTPLNILQIPRGHNEVVSLVFNREFYCIRDNDEEVSCNGLLFYGTASPSIIMLEENDKQVFDDIYTIIKMELTEQDRSLAEMLRVMLKRLIIKSTRLLSTRSIDQGVATEQFEIIRQFNILVEKNYKSFHKLTDYANLLHKSPKTISNIFSQYSNTTPLHIINERIFVEARRLILSSSKSINEISTLLGYKDAGHFSKFFKKNAGVSPLQFKKALHKNQEGKNLQF